MNKSLIKGAVFALSAFATTASFVSTAPVAHAALPAGQVAVSAAGSDTTERMMNDILADLDNRSLTINGSATTVRTYNVPSFSNTPYATQGDADCTDVSWTKDANAPASPQAPGKGRQPFGSTIGRNYLAAENGGTGPGSTTGTDFGCVDIARSSSAPRGAGGGDKSSFEYYAFAFDAVGVATTSLNAPGTLSRDDITKIYNCTYTNWDQVPGGLTGPIQRYFPQAGSGTRSFFQSDVFTTNFDPATFSNANCPAVKLIEENQMVTIADADRDKAIMPYSSALWSYHAQNQINPTLDKRNGARLLGLTTTAGNKKSTVYWNTDDVQYQLDDSATGVIKETNVKQANPAFSEAGGNFPGVRFVYNVLDNVGNRKGYQAAFKLVGFDNISGGAKSPLCDATAAGTGANQFALILQAGFKPLPAATNATSNQAGSTCRFYAGVN